MNATQNTVYDSKAVAYIYLNNSVATSYASFNTFYQSNFFTCLPTSNGKSNTLFFSPTSFSSGFWNDTDTFQSGTLAAENGMFTFFSNIFANTLASGDDVVDLSLAVLVNNDYNLYRAYSGVSPAINDMGKQSAIGVSRLKINFFFFQHSLGRYWNI